MRLLDALAELISPTRCSGCDIPGELLCRGCAVAAHSIEPALACRRCGAPFGAIVCTECWNREFAFEATVCLGEFERPLARAVALHKDGPEQRLGPMLGRMLAARVAQAWPGWAEEVVWVPASPAAVRRRGFDHAEGIATALAWQLGLPAARLLERHDAADQRGLSRDERAANVAGSFALAGATSARRVVLVDDVFTTGATLDAASAVVLSAGVGAVRCACVARTW